MPDDPVQLSLFGPPAPTHAPDAAGADEASRPLPPFRQQGSLFGEPTTLAVEEPHREAAPLAAAPPPPAGAGLLTAAQRAEALARLAREAAGCHRCPLRDGCTQVVFGEGNPDATLMLVGEGPGAQEDLEGRPFVGRAGQLLDRMLDAIGIARSEVYIANIVKCRPPGNRAPTPAEQDACYPYLQRQIELIQPEVILCLGATAARRLIGPTFSVTRDHGVWYDRAGRRVMATFHPAALLRDPAKKRVAWEDLKKVQEAYFGGQA